MKKGEMICLTLEQVSHADGMVEYVPRGQPGGWQRFVEYIQSARGITSFEGYAISDFFRLLIEFALNGKVGTPFVVSQLYDDTDDDAPSYKISLYDLGFDQLGMLDSNIQPSWFKVTFEPKGALYTAVLTPKRSLMKLIYKNLM